MKNSDTFKKSLEIFNTTLAPVIEEHRGKGGIPNSISKVSMDDLIYDVKNNVDYLSLIDKVLK